MVNVPRPHPNDPVMGQTECYQVALLLACPDCLESPGQWCVTPTDETCVDMHDGRIAPILWAHHVGVLDERAALLDAMRRMLKGLP